MKLKKIDLEKAYEYRHSDIKPNFEHQYLIKYDGRFYAGTFSEVWFGLNFLGWVHPLGLQFDAHMSKRWEGVWEIIEDQ